jgi:hypothetical protein
MNYLISSIIALTLSVGGWFGLSHIPKAQTFGAFSDPFISLQLATGPSNGDCLSTDGTNNIWDTCAAGGGGSGTGWASSTDPTSIYFTGSSNVGIGTSSPYAKLSVVGEVVAAKFTATTSTASTFPYASSTSQTVSGTAYAGALNVGSGQLTVNSSGDIATNGNFSNADGSGLINTDSMRTQFFQDPTGTGSYFFFANGAGTTNFVGRLNTTNVLFNVTNNADGTGDSFRVSSSTNASMFNVMYNGNVGVGTTTPYAKLSVVGETVASHFTATTTTATSTLPRLETAGLNTTGFLTFGGVTGNSWDDFCVSITGGAGLCDGTDSSGSGGAGLATSTDIADTYVIYGTSASDVGAEAAFTYNDATNVLTVSNASTTVLSATSLCLTADCRTSWPVDTTASSTLLSDINTWSGRNVFDRASTTQLTLLGQIYDGNNSQGTAGYTLMSRGAGLAPTWSATTTFSSGLTYSAGNVTSDLGTSIDISSETNLAGDAEIVLTGDALSIASTIARDSELHAAVTLAGEDYLSLSTQQITANAIDPDNLSASDFGSFTCNGTTCTVDAGAISNTMLANSTISGIALGSNLADLTIGAGLTSAGAYNGSTARTAAIDFTRSNSWTGLQTFVSASSTSFSALDGIFVGRTATTTIRGETTATSTFAGGIQGTYLNITGTSATSTFARGINLSGGCFSINNVCVGGAGGSGTINSGTTNRLSYYSGATTLDSSIFYYNNTVQNAAFGTTTPFSNYLFTLATSTGQNLTLTDGSLTSAQWNFRNKNGILYFATSSPTTGATTTNPAIQVNPTGNPSLSIATSSTAKILNLGPDPSTTAASSTIRMQKLQFEGLDSAGVMRCVYLVGAAWVFGTGTCN